MLVMYMNCLMKMELKNLCCNICNTAVVLIVRLINNHFDCFYKKIRPQKISWWSLKPSLKKTLITTTKTCVITMRIV